MPQPIPTPIPRSQSGALIDGFRFMARRPGWTLGLVILGMTLGQLGPALELLAHAEKNPIMGMALAWVAMLPMEIYLIPRWISRLDADLLDDPSNARAKWPQLFDQRWLKAFGAGLVVQMVGGIGLLLLIIPGVVVLALAGFAPMRILLRGGSLGDALRWSGVAMAKHWPRIVQAALTILIVVFAASLAMALAENAVFARFGPDGPDAWTRLKHPLVWASQALGSLTLLWVSASFLSLYQRLEKLVAGSDTPLQSPLK